MNFRKVLKSAGGVLRSILQLELIEKTEMDMAELSMRNRVDEKRVTKSIAEMSWEEILALPAKHIPNGKIVAFRKKLARKRSKK